MSNLVIAFNKNWGPLIPDDDNREIVEKTFIAFGKETEKIQKKILIYFSSGSSKFGWFNREGTTKFRGSPDSKRFFESLKHRPNSITQEELDLFKETDYLIFLSHNIRDDGSSIYKVHTIAHELQHVIQHRIDRFTSQKNSIFVHYENENNNWTNSVYRSLPTETDAFLKSKRINYQIHGKDAVDIFFSDMISRVTREEINYWEFIDSLDIEQDYDWIKETSKLWKEQEAYIKNLYNERRGKNSNPFVQAYEYLFSKEIIQGEVDD